jgi:hypothetical protein
VGFGHRARSDELLRYECPIQLAPMGSVSVTTDLALALARAGSHAAYPALGARAASVSRVFDALSDETEAFGDEVPRAGDASRGAERPVRELLARPDLKLVGLVRDRRTLCGWQVESADEACAQFEGQPHLHMVDPDWQEVARAIDSWLTGVFDAPVAGTQHAS